MSDSGQGKEGPGPGAPDSAVPGPPAPEAVYLEKRRDLPGFLVLMIGAGSLLALTAAIFYPFLGPLVIALVLSTLFYPAYRRLLRATGERWRGLAALLTCIAVVVVVFLPLAWIGWEVARCPSLSPSSCPGGGGRGSS